MSPAHLEGSTEPHQREAVDLLLEEQLLYRQFGRLPQRRTP